MNLIKTYFVLNVFQNMVLQENKKTYSSNFCVQNDNNEKQ